MRKLTLTLRCLWTINSIEKLLALDSEDLFFGVQVLLLPSSVILMKTLHLPWPQFLIYKLLVMDLGIALPS